MGIFGDVRKRRPAPHRFQMDSITTPSPTFRSRTKFSEVSCFNQDTASWWKATTTPIHLSPEQFHHATQLEALLRDKLRELLETIRSYV